MTLRDSGDRSAASGEPSEDRPLRRRVDEAAKESRAGNHLSAYDIAKAGLPQVDPSAGTPPRSAPVDRDSVLALRQIQALSLARTGSPEGALKILESLREEGHRDLETTGIWARCHKDLGLAETDPEKRLKCLREAFQSYRDAYREARSSWHGINAATLAVLLGEKEEARRLADGVRSLCLKKLESEASYWPLATLGEAALILGEHDESQKWYRRAAAKVESNWGNLATTYRQAAMLLDALKIDPGPFKLCFPLPKIVVFCGHMVDRPDRHSPRFPNSLVPHVAEQIAEFLEGAAPVIGYSSAACGSDILFQEALRKLKAEAHLVLPYEAESFRADSVEIGAEGEWGPRFEKVLADASELRFASRQRIRVGGVAYDYSNQLLFGLAKLKARELGAELTGLAVWDGGPGDGEGGTATNVRRWRELNCPVHLIDLPRAATGEVAARAPGRDSDLEGRIVSILFADAVNFSTLREEQLPGFARHFLGLVAELLASEDPPPLMKNTWGDGLYLVFEEIGQAGRYALRLAREVAATDWKALGLRPELSLRIALHAGPAYRVQDPVIKRSNFIGSHVSMAARIEPVTPPGQVYASQEFAALAAALGVDDFVFQYAGQTKLPKDYGTFPTYHVRGRERGN